MQARPEIFNEGILISYRVSEHYQSSCFYLKHTFQRLHSDSVSRFKLLSWTHSIDLALISGQRDID